MCKCTPNIRTPFCGKLGCEWPKPEGIRKEGQEKSVTVTRSQVVEAWMVAFYDGDSLPNIDRLLKQLGLE